MTLLGVIGTVAWRRRSLLLTLRSIAAQSLPIDHLCLLFDGFEGNPWDSDGELRAALGAVEATAEVSTRASGGCVERLRSAVALVDQSVDAETLLVIFDDDLVYPEGYVAYMVAAQRRFGGVVALSGLTAKGQHPHYTEDRAVDMPLSEPNIGVSVIPLPVLRGLFAEPLAEEHLHTWTAELLLGYHCWKHRIPITRPAGTLTVRYEPEAVDDRCVWHRHGREEQQAFRERFRALTGWDPRAAPPPLR